VIAAASLKLDDEFAVVDLGLAFPQRDRCGLIEAAVLGCAAGGKHGAGFRSVIAAASLKLEHRRHGRQERPGFRSVIAAASLKRLQAGQPAAAVRAVSAA